MAAPKVIFTKESQNGSPEKKKKKNKKTKSVAANTIFKSNKSYHNPKMQFHQRKNSKPSHQTVMSLASINAPIHVNRLSQMSTDLKLHREYQKALLELQQKKEDFTTAMEIGEQLQEENTNLKDKLETQNIKIQQLQQTNHYLDTKLNTITQTYQQDVNKYENNLEQNKKLINELQIEIKEKDNELTNFIANKNTVNNSNKNYNNFYNFTADEDILKIDLKDLNIKHFQKYKSTHVYLKFAMQLFNAWMEEKEKHKKGEEQNGKLETRIDELLQIQEKYTKLKEKSKKIEEIATEKLTELTETQRVAEQEITYLAVKNSNLEEENEKLLNDLEQREYEVAMLNETINQLKSQGFMSDETYDMMRNTLKGDDVNELFNELNDYDQMDDEQDPDTTTKKNKQNEDNDILDDLLDDDDLFNDDDEFNSSGDDDEKQKIKSKTKLKNKKVDDDKKKEFVGDKIREYLHLTASVVKIKYPSVKTVQSFKLISQVRSLPFHKYHDAMVRLMEKELKSINSKLNVSKSSKNVFNNNIGTLKRRKSILDGLMNLLGGGSDNEASDDEMDKTKK